MNLFREQRKSSLAYWTLLLTSPTGKWSFWGIPITDISQYSIMLNKFFFFGGGGGGATLKNTLSLHPAPLTKLNFGQKNF